jgi:hypothetical protein
MAVLVPAVVSKKKFALSSFNDECWKAPCENCVELLTLAGHPPYDCFPHGTGYRKEVPS